MCYCVVVDALCYAYSSQLDMGGDGDDSVLDWDWLSVSGLELTMPPNSEDTPVRLVLWCSPTGTTSDG